MTQPAWWLVPLIRLATCTCYGHCCYGWACDIAVVSRPDSGLHSSVALTMSPARAKNWLKPCTSANMRCYLAKKRGSPLTVPRMSVGRTAVCVRVGLAMGCNLQYPPSPCYQRPAHVFRRFFKRVAPVPTCDPAARGYFAVPVRLRYALPFLHGMVILSGLCEQHIARRSAHQYADSKGGWLHTANRRLPRLGRCTVGLGRVRVSSWCGFLACLHAIRSALDGGRKTLHHQSRPRSFVAGGGEGLAPCRPQVHGSSCGVRRPSHACLHEEKTVGAAAHVHMDDSLTLLCLRT